jgi:peptide/nickel transport system permease protein
MLRYLIRRLLQAIPILFIISFIAFAIIMLAPGDPTVIYMNPEKKSLTAEEYAELRIQLGLDRPIHIQYFAWLKNTLQGNWGYSLASKRPVLTDIFTRLPNTLLLSGAALLVALLVSIPAGSISALKKYSLIDYAATFGAFIGLSIPGFWFALVLVQIFGKSLGWLPTVGMHNLGENLTGWASIQDVAKHMIMPALVLSLVQMAYWTRYQRSSLVEVLNQDYIRTARAKGLRENIVLIRHAFKNALIPLVTIAGLTLPNLINGSFVIETIFGWPGMGRLGILAIEKRDYPIIMGVTMLSSLMVIFGNLLADIAYAIIDPRIRYN